MLQPADVAGAPLCLSAIGDNARFDPLRQRDRQSDRVSDLNCLGEQAGDVQLHEFGCPQKVYVDVHALVGVVLEHALDANYHGGGCMEWPLACRSG